jgi:hypothetical protein
MKAALMATVAIVTSTVMALADAPKVGEWGVARSYITACRSVDDAEHYGDLLHSEDHMAASKFALNHCRYIDWAAEVLVENQSWGWACVRPRGETECSWLPGAAVATKAEAATWPKVDDHTKCDFAARAFDTKDPTAISSVGGYIMTVLGRLDEADMKAGHQHLNVEERQMVAATVVLCHQKPTSTIKNQADDVYDGMRHLIDQLTPDD